MAVPKNVQEAKGLWKGTSSLNRSWLAEGKRVSESPSRLHVDANDAYATIHYTWAVDGKAQEGTMLVAMDEKSKAVEIGWSDTWHQSSGVMHLTGTGDDAVRTKGTFRAGEETWGWTIDLAFADGFMSLTMANVTPKGVAEWAVRATYRRE